MPAAPAMPNARASELPMMIIIIAPETQSSVCACSSERGRSRLTGWCTAVTSAPISDRGDQLGQLDERLQRMHRHRTLRARSRAPPR